MKDYAERIKQVNRDHLENLSNGIRLVSKKNRDAQSRGEQIDLLKNLKSIKDAMASLDVSKTICSVIPNIDKGDLYASSLRLMSNPHTRRFLLFTFTLHLGYGDAWLNSALNVSASGNRDDLSDMALTLYARKGDIILTEDKMFQRIHKHIDLQQHIQIMTCEKCIEYLKSTR